MADKQPGLLERSVGQSEAGSWDFRCPVNDGSCGEGGFPFTSRGWPSREDALARGGQHFDEHRASDEGYTMPELHDFRVEQGIVDPPPTVITAKEL